MLPFRKLQKTNTMTGGGGWVCVVNGRIERMLGCREISVALLLQERLWHAIETAPIGEAKGEAKEANWKPKTPLPNLATRPPMSGAQKMEDPRNVPFTHFPSSASTISIIRSTSSPSIVVLALQGTH
jgi:hypothetical protein